MDRGGRASVNILGINYFFHDSTACLLVDGKLAVAVEEERLTRQKHTNAFPTRAVNTCLRFVGASYSDVDRVAVSIQPTKNWAARVSYGLSHLSNVRSFASHELVGAYFKQRKFWDWYRSVFTGRRPPVDFVPHHAAHAVGSFLASPYDRAALLSLDGSGEWATSFLGVGEGTQVGRFHESYFPMSLGSFYEAATEFCGFRPNYDEGKTMGLAPFGDWKVFDSRVADIARVDGDGAIKIDLSYFNYQYWGARRCGRKFYEAFGKPRARNDEFREHHQHVAAAFQHVLEERALELATILKRRTGARHLVIAGGVGLNSVMNGRLLREAGFDDIYVMPAAGDNGTAIGAALYSHHVIMAQPRKWVHDDPYLGTAYSDAEIEKLLRECKLRAERVDDVAGVTARLLADGRIVGWFQGRMEIGPRALGGRSIIADPTRSDMKDRINAEVKHREAYRPFAPSVLAEAKDEYFEIKGESPFMLKVCNVRPHMRARLPAITHVDGTARVQTVGRERYPLYYSMIQAFGKLTGVPVVLNTSFNVQGEPIVESPRDALRCFFSTGLDALVLGSFVIRKS